MKKILFLLLTLFVFARPTSAQNVGSEITNTYQVVDKDAVDGDILIFTDKGPVRASVSYDSRLFGILQTTPLLVYRLVEDTGQPIMRGGVAMVNVTNANGPIVKGDYITSFDYPGKGVKADKSGYTVGTALAEFNLKEGQIPVAVRIEFSEISTVRNVARLLEFIGQAFFTDARQPAKFVEIMRYFVAGFIMLISFFFAFVTFSRSVPKAIEAIGRNPLARRFIYLSMVFNIALVIGIVIFGIAGAVIIMQVK